MKTEKELKFEERNQNKNPEFEDRFLFSSQPIPYKRKHSNKSKEILLKIKDLEQKVSEINSQIIELKTLVENHE